MHDEEFDFTDPQMLRKRAEELLKENQKKSHKPAMESDEKKLLHELQVHQIELEMQNEELRQAYETAETALRKYTMLYDLSPLGYLTLEKDGTICELNFTAADMLGERRFSMVGSNFILFISEDSKPVFNMFLSNVFTSNAKESCKVMLGHENIPLCLVYMEGIVTGDDNKCLLSVVDISSFN
jgi:PAS domain-containing protein